MLLLQQKTKTDLFLASTTFWCFIAFLGLITLIARGEGTLPENSTMHFFADHIRYIFPLLFFGSASDVVSFLISTFLVISNIFCYSYMLMMGFYKPLSTSNRYRPFNATYYTIVAILFSLIIVVLANIIKAA
jgi:hypothetical protein